MDKSRSSVQIRSYQSSDIERIIQRHRDIYESEYGFSTLFGDYVEEYVQKFEHHHEKDKENIWIAEIGNQFAGMIAIVRSDLTTAQLRWYLVEPVFRGYGIGHKLMETALQFCITQGYQHVFLWTVDLLKAARHLYENFGFVLTESKQNSEWTKEVLTEERWDLII